MAIIRRTISHFTASFYHLAPQSAARTGFVDFVYHQQQKSFLVNLPTSVWNKLATNLLFHFWLILMEQWPEMKRCKYYIPLLWAKDNTMYSLLSQRLFHGCKVKHSLWAAILQIFLKEKEHIQAWTDGSMLPLFTQNPFINLTCILTV